MTKTDVASLIPIDPEVGALILDLAKRMTGMPHHAIIILAPLVGDHLGEPTFVTSLCAPDMEATLRAVVEGFDLPGQVLVKRDIQ